MPSINIENVNLKTATIEIKALTVNGRQLTLSTFRQIPEDELIDHESVKLNGVPWGTINYFWKDNGDERNNWHVVWQKGNELKRSVIHKNPFSYYEIRKYYYTNVEEAEKRYKAEKSDRYALYRSDFSTEKLLTESYPELFIDYLALKKRYMDILEPFADLPQLFIAI